MDFREALGDVRDLGSKQFTGYARKVYEESKLEALGARKKKREKVPFNILLGMRKKLKKRLERKEQEEKEAHSITATASTQSRSRRQAARKKGRREAGGPAPGRRMAGGVMRVHKGMIGKKRGRD